MLILQRGAVVAAGLAGVLALAGCGSDNNAPTQPVAAGSSSAAAISCADGSLTGTGSTFQLNIEKQWISDYLAKCSAAKVDYTGTGSGAGISQFGSGTVDYAGSDSLMKADEQAKADARCGAGNKAIHLPITAGAAVLTYNLPGVPAVKLSAPVLAEMFQGTITKWDDFKVAADNPGTKLPPLAVQAVHRSDSSGTTDIFSKFLDANAKGVWTLATGKDLKWPGGQSAKGSDGTTNAVKATPGALTYTELSFAKANGLPFAAVKNAGGQYVVPTGASVGKALDAASVDTSKGDLRVSVDYASADAAAYPVSAVTYVIVCDKGNKNAALLKGFLGYATTGGQASADQLGYAPLPAKVAGPVKSALAALA
ncbi:MAG: phosphate ABC transporter substrate-binding protein PstS [Actinomycetota bacterium]|nr:phosphate ABC transporter substrate-binding protein PstS [Actinomycetota bacterium]